MSFPTSSAPTSPSASGAAGLTACSLSSCCLSSSPEPCWSSTGSAGDAARHRLAPPLLFLSTLAVLTHPFLDWLNNYGMRWLMPFEGSWSFGDAVFIMDPWLWLILGSAWLAGRRASWRLVVSWLVIAGLLTLVVAGREPRYLIVVLSVAAGLVLAMVWNPSGKLSGQRLATGGLIAAVVFIAALLILHALTVSRVSRVLPEHGIASIERLMVGPMPVDPLSWSVLAETETSYHFGTFRWWNRTLSLEPGTLPVASSAVWWDRVRSARPIQGFLIWTRFPSLEADRIPGGWRIHLIDVRYSRSRTSGFGGAMVEIQEP